VHLSIRERQTGEVSILELEGRITLGAEADALYQKVRALLDQSHCCILLQMEKVVRVDSAGWGSVMRSVGSARAAGGDVCLLKPSRTTQGLLEILGLAGRPDVLRVFADEPEAVASFSAKA
jgi:anti-sigma B factor antagonist